MADTSSGVRRLPALLLLLAMVVLVVAVLAVAGVLEPTGVSSAAWAGATVATAPPGG